MALALIALPLALAALAAAIPSQRVRPWLLPVAGAAHLGLVTIALATGHPVAALSGWLLLDPIGKVVLALCSVVFFLCSVYAPAYLLFRIERPNRLFCSSALAWLGALTAVALAHHLGLMWVALETTTLASAPLLYFNQNPRSLEATWKFLLIGSVGIAIALLGSFFLAYSALHAGLGSSLLFDDLVANAPRLSRPWLHAAVVLLFVGYGTKMGLAPMHTWKPDAYGEAPGVVGALLAGGLTSGAFLAVLRFFQVCSAAGDVGFARETLLVLGVLSMVVAAVFLARQRDFKRMLAYSSVEHMGILVLGLAIGGPAIFGALLHLVVNALAKGVLFLSAGNIRRAYGSKRTEVVGGALARLPLSASLFVLGFLASAGSPPFGPFLSELTIARAALETDQLLIGATFLVLLFLVFAGMASTVLAVVQGEPTEAAPPAGFRESVLTVAPAAAFLGLVLWLGVHVPRPLETMLRDAAAQVEAHP